MLKYYWRKLRKRLKIKSRKSSIKSKKPTSTKKLNLVVEQRASKIINLVGYTILLLALLDYGILLISAKFFNPIWGWETAGKLVEMVWAPLLGFLLIFYRRNQDLIKPLELRLLSILSWSALLLGTIYLSIAPVIIGNALRINNNQKAQITGQISQQKSQVQEYSQKLNQATNEQLNNLLQTYVQQAPNIAISSPEKLKENLINQIKERQETAQEQIQSNFSGRQLNLFKTTFKWFFGTIISGICLILIWKYTEWARFLRLKK